MRALVFRNDLTRLVSAKLGGAFHPKAFVAGHCPTRLEQVAMQEPAGRDWVPCRTRLTGICGSDLKQMMLDGHWDNPLTALISFPHVLGHEAVGETPQGARVLLDPWLGCGPRGISPACAACEAGEPPGCRNFAQGVLSPGLHLGNCRTSPGTHADAFYAHRSQLHPIPDDITDEAAVLADPVSVSLHAILKRPPNADLPALVYGCGSLGLCAVALLRHLYPDLDIWAISRPGRSAELAASLGANEVLTEKGADAVVRRAACLQNTRPHIPWSGRPWLQEGPGVVYDTVGSAETVETALRMLATGGSLVVSGVAVPRRFEWTPMYFKEIEVVGSNAFGIETLRGVKQHAFLHYLDLLREGLDLRPIITHRFPLAAWQDAFLTLAHRRRTGAVKVLLEP